VCVCVNILSFYGDVCVLLMCTLVVIVGLIELVVGYYTVIAENTVVTRYQLSHDIEFGRNIANSFNS
jgi:hypothetical protein